MDEVRITVHINGRDYPLACAAGEEERIQSLAGRIDAVAKRLPGSANVMGESRLLVMAALILADQLDDMQQQAAQATAAHSRKASPAQTSKTGKTSTSSDDRLAEQIEKIAARLEKLASTLVHG